MIQLAVKKPSTAVRALGRLCWIMYRTFVTRLVASNRLFQTRDAELVVMDGDRSPLSEFISDHAIVAFAPVLNNIFKLS